MDERTRGKPWTEDDNHRFAISYALSKALRLARGVRKQVTEQERALMAQSILDYLKLCGLQITRAPCRPRHQSADWQLTDAATLPPADGTG